GKFVFWNAPAGTYRLIATRPGYARSEYGQRTPNGAGRSITLTSGQQRADLRIHMTQTGSISGRILNSAGQPAGNATVQALKASYADGRRELELVQSARTNDLGEYRLFWLAPGLYFVNVLAPDVDPLVGAGLGEVLMNPDGPDS